MQENFQQIEQTWVDLESLVTVNDDDIYLIQNRGPGILMTLESYTTPDDVEATAGTLIPADISKQGVFIKGTQKLFLKALTDASCAINITKANGSGGGGGQTINNQDITVTENGVYTAESGYTGLGTVTVNVSSGANTQNITVRQDGVYTALNGERLIYSYHSDNPAIIGGYFWLMKEIPEVGDIAYNSQGDGETGYSPDFNSVVGYVTMVDTSGTNTMVELSTSLGQWNEQYSTYSITGNYNALGTVTVNTLDSFIMGALPSTISSNAVEVGAYSLAYKPFITSINLPNAINLGNSALSYNTNLATVSLGSYTGTTLDQQTGRHSYDHYSFGVCAGDTALTSFSAPNLQIIDDEFFTNVNMSNSFTFNVPSLVGIYGNAFGGWDSSMPTPYQITQNLGIDLNDMKFLAMAGDLLEGYIDDNSLTDTLTLSNLITMGQGFTNTNRTQRTYLDNITTFNVPSLKCIEDWCELDLPITALHLTDIVLIGNNALSRCGSLANIYIGSNVQQIEANAFSGLNGVSIDIDLPQPSGSETDWRANAPWGATNATVVWSGS